MRPSSARVDKTFRPLSFSVRPASAAGAAGTGLASGASAAAGPSAGQDADADLREFERQMRAIEESGGFAHQPAAANGHGHVHGHGHGHGQHTGGAIGAVATPADPSGGLLAPAKRSVLLKDVDAKTGETKVIIAEMDPAQFSEYMVRRTALSAEPRRKNARVPSPLPVFFLFFPAASLASLTPLSLFFLPSLLLSTPLAATAGGARPEAGRVPHRGEEATAGRARAPGQVDAGHGRPLRPARLGRAQRRGPYPLRGRPARAGVSRAPQGVL